MGMMGAGMLLWSIIGLVVVALAVVCVVWAVRGLSGHGTRAALSPPERPPGADPLDQAQAELRRRYAAGEISREEYLQGRVDLE